MSNTRGGISVNLLTEWKRFDALPAPIRRLYAAAPFDFAMARADKEARDHRAGRLPLEAWRQRTIDMMCDAIMQQARKTYGPDHPDAVRRRR